jgi:hypothetical protein
MAELHRLEETGFKGHVEINFDGKQAVDLVRTDRRTLDDLEIDDQDLASLRSLAEKIAEA